MVPTRRPGQAAHTRRAHRGQKRSMQCAALHRPAQRPPGCAEPRAIGQHERAATHVCTAPVLGSGVGLNLSPMNGSSPGTARHCRNLHCCARRCTAQTRPHLH